MPKFTVWTEEGQEIGTYEAVDASDAIAKAREQTGYADHPANGRVVAEPELPTPGMVLGFFVERETAEGNWPRDRGNPLRDGRVLAHASVGAASVARDQVMREDPGVYYRICRQYVTPDEIDNVHEFRG